jgi:hypothetical protein
VLSASAISTFGMIVLSEKGCRQAAFARRSSP